MLIALRNIYSVVRCVLDVQVDVKVACTKVEVPMFKGCVGISPTRIPIPNFSYSNVDTTEVCVINQSSSERSGRFEDQDFSLTMQPRN